MTGTPPAARLPRDLAARLFRALYPELDLRVLGDLHVAVPKGTLWYAGHSLSELACQISADPSPGPGGQPRSRQDGTS